MTRVADHVVRYRCPACQGQMLGLVPFEHLLDQGLGARLWVASSEGSLWNPCPFCDRPMRQIPPAPDRPPATAVCRTCEQVWIPLAADPWISEHSPARGPSPLRQVPTECTTCGAPWQPDEQGACPYCHAQLTAPVLVTLDATQPAPAPQPFLNTVIGLFDRGSRF
jgi:hypothetical protein